MEEEEERFHLLTGFDIENDLTEIESPIFSHRFECTLFIMMELHRKEKRGKAQG